MEESRCKQIIYDACTDVWKLNWIFIFPALPTFYTILSNPLRFCKKIANDISNLTDDVLVNLLLYGSQTFNFEENSTIIKASIKYILSTERFSGPLMWPFNITNYIKPINICIWPYPFLQTLIWTINTVKCWMLNFYPFYCCLNFFGRWLRFCICVVSCIIYIVIFSYIFHFLFYRHYNFVCRNVYSFW